jgi:5-methylcytosine-specific restriction enzyme A
MKTYLFTWNPKLWPWDDLAKNHPGGTASGKIIKERWSCGVSKQIEIGSRAFLMRLGNEPRGIVASGWVRSEPYEGLHWDKQKAAIGIKTLYVECDWDCLLDEALCLPRSELIRQSQGNFNWTPQAAGTRIPSDLAARLEAIWSAHNGILNIGGLDTDDELWSIEGEPRMALIRHRKRERALRDTKIREALKRANGRLNCEVPNCSFDFFEVYGKLGFEFAHVHHLKPLGDRTVPSKTNLKDLAIVCANCHAIIHRGGACRPLEGLIQQK